MNEEDIRRMADEVERIAETSVNDSLEMCSAENPAEGVILSGGPGSFNHADFGDEMIARHRMCFIDGAPAIWDGTYYLVGKEAIYAAMVKMNRNIKQSQRNEVMAYLEITAPRVPIADPRFIAFENGVLDLETLELLACTPELAMTNVIPHKWNPCAVCHDIDAALVAWTCGHPDRLALLLEMVGLCVYRGREFQKCLILLGEGANGKSTFMDLLRHAVGRNNVSALDLVTMGARFQSVALMGKLANIADDIPSDFVSGKALSVFRKTVTGNPVDAEYKGGATFDFRPYCTVVLSANKMPKMKVSDDGVTRRFAPILFEAKFSTAQGNLNINLPRILESEEASERLLYCGVMALREALKRGSLTDTSERSEIVDEIRQDSSSVYEFACEVLGFGTDEAKSIVGFTTDEFYSDYCDFCDESNRMKSARNSFTSEMCQIYGIGHKRTWVQTAKGKRQKSCFVQKQ